MYTAMDHALVFQQLGREIQCENVGCKNDKCLSVI